MTHVSGASQLSGETIACQCFPEGAPDCSGRVENGVFSRRIAEPTWPRHDAERATTVPSVDQADGEDRPRHAWKPPRDRPSALAIVSIGYMAWLAVINRKTGTTSRRSLQTRPRPLTGDYPICTRSATALEEDNRSSKFTQGFINRNYR